MNKPRFLTGFSGACLLAFATAGLAQGPDGFGRVESLNGDVRADTRPLASGTRLSAPVTLTTLAGSTARVRFDDGMDLALDEKTIVRVDEFADSRAALTVLAGTARLVTGGIAARNPQQLFVRTPQANVGLTGPADFTVAVVDSAAWFSVARGGITVTNNQGEVAISAGESAVVRARNAAPAVAAAGEVPRSVNAVSSPAGRQEPRFWVGAAVGRSSFDRGAVSRLITSGNADTTSTGYKLFAGYRLHRYVGLEAAWVDLGKIKYDGTFAGTPVTGGQLTVKGGDLSVLGMLPIGPSLTAFGKAGLFIWQADASDRFAGTSFSARTSGRKASFGLGASYAVTRPLAVRVEWEDFKFGDDHAKLLSAGLVFSF